MNKRIGEKESEGKQDEGRKVEAKARNSREQTRKQGTSHLGKENKRWYYRRLFAFNYSEAFAFSSRNHRTR